MGRMDFAIGELARRTGLTVKTIRFYSDRGLVPPSRRDSAGRRRYDHDAVARLTLVRTLRELGLDLAAISRVVRGDAELAEVAAAHAAAIDVQMRVLRLRRVVLSRVATGASPDRVRLLLDLVAGERERLVDDFLDAAFAGCPPAYAGIRRSLTPELPEDPTAEQWDAWIELMSLVEDADFRDSLSALISAHVNGRDPDALPRRDPVAAARELARPALAVGVRPESPGAAAAVAALAAEFDGPVLDTLRTAGDERWDRYNALLSVVNGWELPEPTKPAVDWFVSALTARQR